MSGGGPPIGANFNISPYRKEITKQTQEERNFEVCQPKESISTKGIIRRKKTYRYIHLDEDEDGNKWWNILIVPPEDEPHNYTLNCSSSEESDD